MQNISPIKQRILQFVDTLGISKREFYAKTGISRGTLESKTGITEDTLAKLFAAYPDLNTGWVITGKESTIKEPAIVEDSEPPPYSKQCLLCKEKERIIQKLEDCLKTKDITIESLQSERTILKEYIEDLKKQLFEAHQEKPGEQKRKAS
ncbi:MAG: hypothetical protein JEY96_16780 [Bacteroidales bacterium]|nr:hypothetical protein [Bacteroidales bacterium]